MQKTNFVSLAAVISALLLTFSITNVYAQSSGILEAPALLSPGPESVNPNLPVVFSWVAVSGATGYEIQISRFSDFPMADTQTKTVFQNSYAMNTVDTVGPAMYYWRVASIHDYTKGAYSDPFSFSLGVLPVYQTNLGQNDEMRVGSPAGLTLDKDLNVYMTDYAGHRVLKFAKDGTFLNLFGEKGQDAGMFNRPFGISYHDGFVYVADSGNNRIQKFSPDGVFVASFGTADSGKGALNGPTGIAIDDKGYVYVSDTGNNRVAIFNTDGDFVVSFGDLNRPGGIAVDKNYNIYVADSANNRIAIYASNFGFISEWGGKCGPEPGKFCNPTDVIIDENGAFYIADSGNNRIQKLEKSGAFVSSFGSIGKENGQFNTPTGIAIESNEKLYVADNANGRVQIFSLVDKENGPLCVDNNSWCYSFESSSVAIEKLTLGGFQTITATVLAGGNEDSGMFWLHATITDPEGNKIIPEPQAKMLFKGQTEKFAFIFKPEKVGKYSVLLEITPPERRSGHVFHTNTLSFTVEAPQSLILFERQVTVDQQQVSLKIGTTSVITDFLFSESGKRLSFHIDETGNSGITRIPVGRILEGPYVVTFDGKITNDYLLEGNGSDALIVLSYPPGSHLLAVEGTLAGLTPFEKEITIAGQQVNLQITTTSAVGGLEFDEAGKKLSLEIDESASSGIARVEIGQILEGPYAVMLDGQIFNDYKIQGQGTQTILEIDYNSGEHTVDIVGNKVIPEFPVLLLPLVLVGAIAAITMLGRSRLALK